MLGLTVSVLVGWVWWWCVTRVRSFRAAVEEWLVWQLAADRAGLSLNGWVRRALCRVAELERVLASEGEPTRL